MDDIEIVNDLYAARLNRSATIRLLTGNYYDDEVNVVCPHCKSNYTHVMNVGTLVGSSLGEAVDAYPGTAPIGRTPYRRSAVQIVFTCEECPNLFGLVIQQHKGINLVEIRPHVKP